MTAHIPFKLAFAFLVTWTFVLVYGVQPDRSAHCLSANASAQGDARNGTAPTADSGLTLPLSSEDSSAIAHLRVDIDQAPQAGQVDDVLQRLPGFGRWQVLEEDARVPITQTLDRLDGAASGEEASRLMLKLLANAQQPTDDAWETFEDLLDFHVVQPATEGAILQAGLARLAEDAPLERVANWYERLLNWEAYACSVSASPTSQSNTEIVRQSALCDRAPELSVQLEPFLAAASLVKASSWRSELEATVRRCAGDADTLIADALVGEGRWTGTSWHWYGWRVEYNQTLAVVNDPHTGETVAAGPGAKNRYPLAPVEQELVACIERNSQAELSAPANQELDLMLARAPTPGAANKELAAVKMQPSR